MSKLKQRLQEHNITQHQLIIMLRKRGIQTDSGRLSRVVNDVDDTPRSREIRKVANEIIDDLLAEKQPVAMAQ